MAKANVAARKGAESQRGKGWLALVIGLGFFLVLAKGCGGAAKLTKEEKLRVAAATGKRVAVVRLTPVDAEFDSLPALHVSGALVKLLREQGLFRRVDYVFDQKSVPADADYILTGRVSKGVPRKSRNTAAVHRLLLTVSIVGAGFRKTVRDHDYQVEMEAELLVAARGKAQPVGRLNLKVTAKGDYADVDRGTVDVRVCRMAERNLAVAVINGVFDALSGKPDPHLAQAR